MYTVYVWPTNPTCMQKVQLMVGVCLMNLGARLHISHYLTLSLIHRVVQNH